MFDPWNDRIDPDEFRRIWDKAEDVGSPADMHIARWYFAEKYPWNLQVMVADLYATNERLLAENRGLLEALTKQVTCCRFMSTPEYETCEDNCTVGYRHQEQCTAYLLTIEPARHGVATAEVTRVRELEAEKERLAGRVRELESQLEAFKIGFAVVASTPTEQALAQAADGEG